MELRTLRYFLTVCQEGTISKAAEVLYLTQPTLSKQLKELENELDTVLFNRGHKRITLTDDGYYLKKKAEEILSLTNQTQSNFKKNRFVGGNLAIGSGETHLFKQISEVVTNMMRTHPDVTISLLSGNSDNLLGEVEKGLLDFALVIDPVDKQKYGFLRLVGEVKWGLLLNASHQLAQCDSITAEDLAEIPLLISSQTMIGDQLSSWLGKNSQDLTIAGTYNLLYNASLLAEVGDLGVLCIDGLINGRSNLKFVPLSPESTSAVYIVWKKEAMLSKVAQLFVKELDALTAQKRNIGLD